MDHKPPCEVTQAKVNARALQGEQSSERPEQPLRYVPTEPSETCYYIETSLGLGVLKLRAILYFLSSLEAIDMIPSTHHVSGMIGTLC